MLGEGLWLSGEERQNGRRAGLRHDIGKVGDAGDVLSGAVMREQERIDAVRDHADVGEGLLVPIGLDAPIAHTVRHHHERYDGAGYPDGLAGEDIPLASRIIGITDAFDAMTCERPYRRARTRDEALVELRSEAGGQFDPNIVGIFCELVMSGATDAVGEANSLFFEEEPAATTLAPIQDRGAA